MVKFLQPHEVVLYLKKNSTLKWLAGLREPKKAREFGAKPL